MRALPVKRGRPRLAVVVSQIPATRVPAELHDSIVLLALHLGVPVARVVREALVSHLQSVKTVENGAH